MENSNNFDSICSYNNKEYNKRILVPFCYSNTENTELWKPKHILNKLISISKNKYFIDNIKQEYKFNVNIIFIVSLPNGIPKEGLLIVGNIKGLGNNKISNGHYLIPIHHDEDIPHCWISTRRINIRKCTEIKFSIFRYIKHYWKSPIVIGELEPHSVYNLNDNIENNAYIEYKRSIKIPNNNKYNCYIIHLQYNNSNYIKISPVSNISHISKIKKEIFSPKFKNYENNIEELLISNTISYTDFDYKQDFCNECNINISNNSLEMLINDRIDNYNLNKEKNNNNIIDKNNIIINNEDNINKYIDNNSKFSLNNELNNTIDDNDIYNFIRDNSTIKTNCQFIFNSKKMVKEVALTIEGNSNNLDIKNTLFLEDKNIFNKYNKSNSNKILTNKLQNSFKKYQLNEENIINIKINELINNESFESNYSEESDMEFQKQTILERIYRTRKNVNKFRSIQFNPNYISNFCKNISNNITEKNDHGYCKKCLKNIFCDNNFEYSKDNDYKKNINYNYIKNNLSNSYGNILSPKGNSESLKFQRILGKADYLLENILLNEEEIENPNIKINNIYNKKTIELDSLNVSPKENIQSTEITENLLIEKSNNLNEQINNINIEINEKQRQINNSELINLSIIKTKEVDILNDYEDFNKKIRKNNLLDNNQNIQDIKESNIQDKDNNKELQNKHNYEKLQDKDNNKELQNEDHYIELLNKDHYKELLNKDYYMELEDQDNNKELQNEDHYTKLINEDHYKKLQNEIKYLNNDYNQVSNMNNDNNYNHKDLNIKLLNKKKINKKSHLINTTLELEKTIRPFAIPLWSTSWSSILTYKF